MNRNRTTGVVLIVSENTSPIQLTRATGSCLKHLDVESVLIVNRSWRSATQDQMTRIPKMHPHRVRLAQTMDPVQELSRWILRMRFTAVIDSMVTLADDSIEHALDRMVGPGDRARVGAVTAKPRWAGSLFRTEALHAARGIDLSDERSVMAAVRNERWKIRSGLNLNEGRIVLGPESLRRFPDKFRPIVEPVPRAGNEITLTARRRTRR